MRKATTRPEVILGYIQSRDKFTLVNRQHALAQLIEDAGGRYIWADKSHHVVILNWIRHPVEAVFAAGAKAPKWVGGTQGQTTVAGLIASDPHYGWFKSVQTKRIYTYDLGYQGEWAYPFWDQSLTRPDVMLRETLYAIHPELFSTPPEAQFLRHLK